MQRRECLRRAAILLVLLLAACVPAAAQSRIIAIGDVHGAYTEFLAILQRAGLVDNDGRWTGGDAVLVQVGDVMDRGPRSRDCLNLLMELEKQAEKAGGRVVPVLGNHEVMNMMGDLRYVSPAEYQSFASDQSEKIRADAYQDYRKFLAGRGSRRRQPPPPDDEASRQKWMADHPLGFFEHRDAYAPQGAYGHWLRTHDAVVQVGDSIFLHGGLDPKLRFRNLEEINKRVRQELTGFDQIWQALTERKIVWRYMKLEEAIREVQDEMAAMQAGNVLDQTAVDRIKRLLEFQSWMIVHPEGPLWYRGYAQQPEDKLQKDLQSMLERLKAKHVVVGHSPTATHKIMPRFDNLVFLIDTGMLVAYYKGQPSALQIQNGAFTGLYPNGVQEVLLGPASGAAPANGRPQSQGGSP